MNVVIFLFSANRHRSPRSFYPRRSCSPKPSTSGYKRSTNGSPNQSEKYKRRSHSPHERNVSKTETGRYHLEGYKGRRKHSKSPHPGYKGSTHRSPSPYYYRSRRSRSPDDYRRHKYMKDRRSRSRSKEKYRKLHERTSRSPYSKRKPRLEEEQDMISSKEIGYVGPILPDLAFYGVWS